MKNKTRKINWSHFKSFPKNCPVIEETADGVSCGVCTFYIGTEKVCPRHGKIVEIENDKQYEIKINLTQEEVNHITNVVMALVPDKSFKKLSKLNDEEFINLLAGFSRKEFIKVLMMNRPIL